MKDSAAIARPSLVSRFLHHLVCMPKWHRYVLLGAIALATVGGMGRVRQFIAPAPPPTAQHSTGPGLRNGFVDSTPPGNSQAADANTVPWYLSPRFLNVGGSVLGGFIVGWLMRMFVKMTALIGLTIGAVIAGLSYFHVMNVDFTNVQQHYSSDMSWLADQASRLKDVAISYLPVHAGGLFGMFMGFRRPKL